MISISSGISTNLSSPFRNLNQEILNGSQRLACHHRKKTKPLGMFRRYTNICTRNTPLQQIRGYLSVPNSRSNLAIFSHQYVDAGLLQWKRGPILTPKIRLINYDLGSSFVGGSADHAKTAVIALNAVSSADLNPLGYVSCYLLKASSIFHKTSGLIATHLSPLATRYEIEPLSLHNLSGFRVEIDLTFIALEFNCLNDARTETTTLMNHL
jgi:hypothetical protein